MPAVVPVHLSVSCLPSIHCRLRPCVYFVQRGCLCVIFLQSYNLLHTLHVAQLLYQLF